MEVLMDPLPFPPEKQPVRQWCVPTHQFACMRAWRSADVGRAAEQRLEDIALAYGCTVTRSTPMADAKDHWDVCVVMPSTEGGATYRIDVKAMKKMARNDATASTTHTYIELHGKHRYNQGWLYGGMANLIAFEIPTGFLLCHRTVIKDFITAKVDRSKVVREAGMAALYKVYERNVGDCDQVTLVALKDLAAFPNLVFAEWCDRQA
jgi:hypothetical protein